MFEEFGPSAFVLADKIKQKEVSPVEVVKLYIERAERWQPNINALVETRFAEALREASAKEKQLRSPGDLPPLFGVPFSCKEILACEGLKSTGGNIYAKNRVSESSATVVSRVREAGAILLGTTNVPELGFWFETNNVIYGRTQNPHRFDRTSGGSSGGEAALVAARGSAFGLGSDLGGSLRIPAAFCGIFAHKPSAKCVPLTGHYPYSDEDVAAFTEKTYPYTANGPLTSCAADLHGLLKIISGPDGVDPFTRNDFKLRPLLKDVSQLKVFSLPNPQIYLAQKTGAAERSAVQQSTRYLEQMGCEVSEFPWDFFVEAVGIWLEALKATQTVGFRELLNPNSFHLGREFFNLAAGRARHTFPSLTTALLERFDGKRNSAEAFAKLARLKQALNERLGESAVLLMPTQPFPAPKHGRLLRTPFDFIYAGIFNVLEVPVTQCPVGLDEDALPTGVQIVAGYGADHLGISVAQALEVAFGGAPIPSNK